MTTKEFIEKLNTEVGVAILEKIQDAGKNPEAVYAIAQEVGVADSIEEFQAEMKKQYDAMSAELTEEELLAVAGGASVVAGAVCGVYAVVGIAIAAGF